MASLYDLTGDYAKFAFIAEQDDLDDDMKKALVDALSNLSEDIDDKLEGYTKVIKNFEADMAALDSEIKRLSKRYKRLKDTVADMKDRMKEAIVLTTQPDKKGVIKRSGTLFSFTIKNCQPSLVHDVEDIKLIPDKYLVEQEPKIAWDLIKDTLINGDDSNKEELEGIAHLEPSVSLLIK